MMNFLAGSIVYEASRRCLQLVGLAGERECSFGRDNDCEYDGFAGKGINGPSNFSFGPDTFDLPAVHS